MTDRAVDTHIVNLRRKIETSSAEPVYVVSVRRLGYRSVVVIALLKGIRAVYRNDAAVTGAR